MFSYSVIIFVIIFIACPSYSLNNKGDECSQDGPCTCIYPNSFEINLKNITINGFISSDANNSHIYFYAPCNDLPINQSEPEKKSALWVFNATLHNGTTPLDPAQVLSGKVNGSFTSIGFVDTAKFEMTGLGNNGVIIEYDHSGTKSEVELDCADKPTVLMMNTNSLPPTYTHSLILRGDIACAKLSVPAEHRLSIGSVLVIMLLTFVIIYLVGGMLLLKYIRGAEGLEMIPNIEFWQGLPSLVRDGIKYALTCGRASASDSYERI